MTGTATDAAARLLAETYAVSQSVLVRCFHEFMRLMEAGLAEDGHAMAMIPTYVTQVPTGDETGTYLALDLGGTNVRICSVTLKGDGRYEVKQAKRVVPDGLQTAAAATELFAFIAAFIREFLLIHSTVQQVASESDAKHLSLGFTFSFPVLQKAVDRGVLLRWSKGYHIEDAIGKDIAQLLQQELDQRQIPVRVTAMINDTVGTLMARSYTNKLPQGSLVGSIFGTGTNGCYIERLSNIPKLKHLEGKLEQMIINLEWGAFDNGMRVLPSTEADIYLDAHSINPKEAMLEKRVSGMYLGELWRLSILSLGFSHLSESSSVCLATQYGVDTAVLSHLRTHSSTEKLQKVLADHLGVDGSQLEPHVCHAAKQIADAISTRSARLAAVAIAAICQKSGRLDDPTKTLTREDIVDVGVDGSMVEHYPGYIRQMKQAIEEILGPDKVKFINMGMAKDGSGVGAALAASQALKQTRLDP